MSNSKSQLNLFDLSMIVVSLVIGMGIFKNPAIVAADSGTSSIFFGVWIAGGVIALCGALTYAEIGLRMPAIGGYYKIFAQSYHPAVGFTVNTIILISNAASLAVVALIGAEYAGDLVFPKGESGGWIFNTTVAIVSVAAFFLVNLAGLRTSSRTQNVLTIIKVALVVILIASMFKGVMVEPHRYTEGVSIRQFTGNNGWTLFIICLTPVCFAYGGYQQTINFGGEVKNTRIIPKGIIMGIIIVVVLYLLLNLAYTQVIGYDKMKGADAIGTLLCEVWFGKTGGQIFNVCMFLSVLAYVNILLMSNPRVMFAMSQDKVFPKIFSWRHPKTEALVPGLLLFSLITIIITFFGKGVDNILKFTMFLDSIGMITSAAALFVLRKRKQNEHLVTGKWNRFTPICAAFFMFSYFLVAVGVVISGLKWALIGCGLLLFFLAIYFIFYHKKKS